MIARSSGWRPVRPPERVMPDRHRTGSVVVVVPTGGRMAGRRPASAGRRPTLASEGTYAGRSVCRELRARGQQMPVLMLTARDSVDDRVAGLDCGADDYLIKPFAFRELLARVRALLRRDGLSKDPVLRVADLEIDTVTHEVRRGGQPVELTSKEYA